MRDRVFFPLAALLALGMIALALIWPRGMGAAYPSLSHPLTLPAPVPAPPPPVKKAAKAAPAAATTPGAAQ
ncbi:MAG: hypothetical protein K9G59_17445 [Caulobacter sp.]|nr:hypothetical protein [Caulobacter sp.]